MDLLEHPLEAVAFRLYSLPEASAATNAAAWTCLAAVVAAAAAAGLWRLRGASAPTAVSIAAAKRPELDPTPAEEAPSTAKRPERWPEPTAAASPKERYTAYYPEAGGRVGCCVDHGDGDREDDADEDQDGGGGHGAYETSSEAAEPFGWEEVVKTLPLNPKPAELGRYRSPTGFGGGGGGSVVQLWDQVAGGGLTPTTPSPRRRGLVVATAPAAF